MSSIASQIEISGYDIYRDLSAAVVDAVLKTARILYAHVFLFVSVGPISLLITLYLVVF